MSRATESKSRTNTISSNKTKCRNKRQPSKGRKSTCKSWLDSWKSSRLSRSTGYSWRSTRGEWMTRTLRLLKTMSKRFTATCLGKNLMRLHYKTSIWISFSRTARFLEWDQTTALVLSKVTLTWLKAQLEVKEEPRDQPGDTMAISLLFS